MKLQIYIKFIKKFIVIDPESHILNLMKNKVLNFQKLIKSKLLNDHFLQIIMHKEINFYTIL